VGAEGRREPAAPAWAGEAGEEDAKEDVDVMSAEGTAVDEDGLFGAGAARCCGSEATGAAAADAPAADAAAAAISSSAPADVAASISLKDPGALAPRPSAGPLGAPDGAVEPAPVAG
jgi:hypothetical protein